jgi:hypothetical protein
LKNSHFDGQNVCFFKRVSVEFSNFVSRVRAQIVKRMVVRFYWNFNTMIWHLYVFILATWKNFPITENFSTAKKRKNKAIFRNFETSVNLFEIFYVMKVVGKIRIRVAIFHIGRTVNFHFHPLLNFPTSGSGVISGLKKLDFFRNFSNFTPKSKVKISKIGSNYSLRLPQL